MKSNGKNKGQTLETQVTFEERHIDENGHVGHESIIRAAYDAQQNHFSKIFGRSYNQIQSQGGMLVVMIMKTVEFRNPIYEEEKRVKTTLLRARHAVLTFKTTITDPTDGRVHYNEKRKLAYLVNNKRTRLPSQFDRFQI